MRTSRAALAIALLIAPPALLAAPTNYQISFNVDFVTTAIDPDVRVGKTYYGSFTVDSALLDHDGLNQLGNVSQFAIQMEDIIWNLGAPFPQSAFSGFRGPTGRFASSPGFDVLGGEITNLRGGVFGIVDEPFVDFSTYLPPGVPTGAPLSCPGSFCGNKVNSFGTVNPAGTFGGSMAVVRVSEPSTLALLVFGMAALAIHRNVRRRWVS